MAKRKRIFECPACLESGIHSPLYVKMEKASVTTHYIYLRRRKLTPCLEKNVATLKREITYYVFCNNCKTEMKYDNQKAMDDDLLAFTDTLPQDVPPISSVKIVHRPKLPMIKRPSMEISDVSSP